MFEEKDEKIFSNEGKNSLVSSQEDFSCVWRVGGLFVGSQDLFKWGKKSHSQAQ
jgi:hypothetical protein